MDYLLVITKILSFLTTIGLPVSLIGLVIGAILDIKNKKFYWSKFALLFLIATFILLLVQIKLTYQLTSSFK